MDQAARHGKLVYRSGCQNIKIVVVTYELEDLSGAFPNHDGIGSSPIAMFTV